MKKIHQKNKNVSDCGGEEGGEDGTGSAHKAYRMNNTSGHNLRSKAKTETGEGGALARGLAAHRPADSIAPAAHAPAAMICKASFPHIRQKYDWDCGLVCCQMCLKWINQPQAFSALTRRCPTQSTWSIDLAYLLHGYGVQARYCTITWGADESYKSIEYYKANLDSDASRVNDLFENAAKRGLVVEMRSLPIDTIIHFLQPETSVVIILVDTKCFELGCAEEKLRASRSRSGANSSYVARLPESIPSMGVDRGFVGHYVVLVAYDKAQDTFQVSDPGVAAERRAIKKDALDLARKQHGLTENLPAACPSVLFGCARADAPLCPCGIHRLPLGPDALTHSCHTGTDEDILLINFANLAQQSSPPTKRPAQVYSVGRPLYVHLVYIVHVVGGSLCSMCEPLFTRVCVGGRGGGGGCQCA